MIAAHNSAHTIAKTVASVRLQTFQDWELLVVDDGSTDETARIVESIPDTRIRVIKQANSGPAAARNTGLQSARGGLISTLDSDDLWMPAYLEHMTALLERAPEAHVAYIDAWTLDDETGRIRRTSAMKYQRPPVPPPASASAFFDVLLVRNFVYNSVTMRREVAEAVGGFDVRFWGTEDWELWLRIASEGYRFARADERLAVYRQRAGSVSADPERMFDGVLKVYKTVAEEWDVSAEIKERARSLAGRYHHRSKRLALGFPKGDLLAPVRLAKRAVERRTLWYSEPPRDVGAALAAIDALATRETA